MENGFEFEDIKRQIDEVLASLGVEPFFDSSKFIEYLSDLGEEVYAHALDGSEGKAPIQEAKSAARRLQSVVTGFTAIKFAQANPSDAKVILSDLPAEVSEVIEHNAQILRNLLSSSDEASSSSQPFEV